MKQYLPAEDPILEWKAPQHFHPERTRSWYVAAAVFALGCISYGVYTEAWTFIIVLALSGIALWRLQKVEPVIRTMRIWKRGFAIDNTFTEWQKCNGYWIMQGSGYFELHIETKQKRDIKILTGNVSPFLIHEQLSSLADELHGRKESILDTIIRICKL